MRISESLLQQCMQAARASQSTAGLEVEQLLLLIKLGHYTLPWSDVPEEQFLARQTQVVEVADVVAIAIDIAENDAARGGPLDVFTKVPGREAAQAAVGLHRPIDGPEAFLRGDDACDGRRKVSPLQLLINEPPVIDIEVLRIDDQAYFLVFAVAYAEEAIGLGERERAQYAHLQIRTIFFDRQPQRGAVREEAQLLRVEENQLRCFDESDRGLRGFLCFDG